MHFQRYPVKIGSLIPFPNRIPGVPTGPSALFSDFAFSHRIGTGLDMAGTTGAVFGRSLATGHVPGPRLAMASQDFFSSLVVFLSFCPSTGSFIVTQQVELRLFSSRFSDPPVLPWYDTRIPVPLCRGHSHGHMRRGGKMGDDGPRERGTDLSSNKQQKRKHSSQGVGASHPRRLPLGRLWAVTYRLDNNLIEPCVLVLLCQLTGCDLGCRQRHVA